MATGVIGLGNMGSALANLIAGNGHEVIGWDINRDCVAEINEEHTNHRFLGGIALDARLRADSDLRAVLRQCNPLFIALPSRFILGTLQPVLADIPRSTLLVNIAKGMHPDSGETAFSMISALLPDNPKIHLSGPSIANEYAHGKPTAVMIAGHDPHQLRRVSALLDNDHFVTRHSDDPVGVELGGVLKNAYALGLGLMEASGARSINFKGSYLTQALKEMQLLGTALGAKAESFLEISGIGDLVTTALSEHSHNAHMGHLLASGKSVEDIRQEIVLPEGFNTLGVILKLAGQHGLSLPLAETLQALIRHELSPARAIHRVLAGSVAG